MALYFWLPAIDCSLSRLRRFVIGRSSVHDTRFHGDNTGSNPVGYANKISNLYSIDRLIIACTSLVPASFGHRCTCLSCARARFNQFIDSSFFGVLRRLRRQPYSLNGHSREIGLSCRSTGRPGRWEALSNDGGAALGNSSVDRSQLFSQPDTGAARLPPVPCLSPDNQGIALCKTPCQFQNPEGLLSWRSPKTRRRP